MFPFKNKEQVDAKLEEYYKEKKDEIDDQLDEDITAAREKADIEYLKYKLEIEIKGANELGDCEHKWHSTIQERNTEIAKLDAEISSKRFILEGILAEKDRTIATLTEVVKELSKRTCINTNTGSL